MNKNPLKNNSNMFLDLLSPKIKVMVIGGGKAAYIKSRTFALKGCQVFVLSPEFIPEFDDIKGNLNVNVIPGVYQKKYIEDKHIVVVATHDRELNEAIGKHCRQLCKIYLDASEPERGNCIIPCQRNTENISLGVNTRGVGVSPITSVFIADKVKKYLGDYDDFVKFTSKIRNHIENVEDRRKIMKFICSEDFYFFYRKGKSSIIIEMFFRVNNN
ncbi:NAD(P)-dependent oxidoreductase [Clostridium luticellarii]|jgi:precorrin-2 dehydrogenase/sirohydrochlorin ferrochelatase|uniref:precorrin-2 dehydrogenase n=1 Tax=Clostridium luticellarii TaxID=1691940 RepID=A0A2T0BMP2_9CLOT|nr:NAD(P)-dependent oxidoreductase [Clostridium luticellarii]MCI1945256.1 NAD(P)-dependent oxidoreductase [Clostridium luticellarii]MCI1968996.1 NAD(P)-dependent oxidoreductase [Clostridium luticellarii]PRR85092.1 Precorrin-2 dehydrogenase [Clostridium luticellarii]